MSAASRRWEKRNPERHLAYKRAYQAKLRAAGKVKPRQSYPTRKTARRALLLEVKRRPCMDCGGTFDPVCMDFDHRDGATKVDTVSNLVGCTEEKLFAEIAKCDVVCANCHRLRTKSRREASAGAKP